MNFSIKSLLRGIAKSSSDYSISEEGNILIKKDTGSTIFIDQIGINPSHIYLYFVNNKFWYYVDKDANFDEVKSILEKEGFIIK